MAGTGVSVDEASVPLTALGLVLGAALAAAFALALFLLLESKPVSPAAEGGVKVAGAPSCASAGGLSC